MDEDWLDTLLRGTYEVSVPTLNVTSCEIGDLTGSGQISPKTSMIKNTNYVQFV